MRSLFRPLTKHISPFFGKIKNGFMIRFLYVPTPLAVEHAGFVYILVGACGAFLFRGIPIAPKTLRMHTF